VVKQLPFTGEKTLADFASLGKTLHEKGIAGQLSKAPIWPAENALYKWFKFH